MAKGQEDILGVFKKRADYPNDFEFIKDNGELVVPFGNRTCVIFQDGEFWIADGATMYSDFADYLGFSVLPISFWKFPCIIKNGELWEHKLLHPADVNAIMVKAEDKRSKNIPPLEGGKNW